MMEETGSFDHSITSKTSPSSDPSGNVIYISETGVPPIQRITIGHLITFCRPLPALRP